jgi:hypothetical protein
MNKEYVCEYCKKSYESAVGLKTHQGRYSSFAGNCSVMIEKGLIDPTKNHSCEYCNKSFSHLHHLKSHQGSVKNSAGNCSVMIKKGLISSNRPFECPHSDCNYAARLQQNLRGHKKTCMHLNGKPIPFANTPFKIINALISGSHGESASSIVGEKGECQKCKEIKIIRNWEYDFCGRCSGKEIWRGHKCYVCEREGDGNIVLNYDKTEEVHNCDSCANRKRNYNFPTYKFYKEEVFDKFKNCSICEVELDWFSKATNNKQAHIDHIHFGKVRGVLCSLCNMNLGAIEETRIIDPIVWADKLKMYLIDPPLGKFNITGVRERIRTISRRNKKNENGQPINRSSDQSNIGVESSNARRT